MKKLAFAASITGALALAACGSSNGDDDISIFPDAGMGADANPFTAECNPVNQMGCADPGDKCTWLVENPDLGLGRTACIPNGTITPGGQCEYGDLAEGGRADNCQATDNVGYLCTSGVCTEICSRQPGFGCSDGHCVLFTGLFTDAENTGLCVPRCDTHLQDCGEGRACYHFLSETDGICANVPEDAVTRKQNFECLKGGGGGCFLNGCAAGYGPELFRDNSNSIDGCSYYCEPIDTYLDINDDLVGGPATGNAGATNQNGLPRACVVGAELGNMATGPHHCRFLQSSYNFSNLPIDPEDITPETGFCAPAESSWGDCTQYRPEHLAAFLAENENNTAQQYCDAPGNETHCPFGCVGFAKLEEIFGAYNLPVPDYLLMPPELRGKTPNFTSELDFRMPGGIH